MKTLALITIYVLSFVCIYFILSLIGIIFTDYRSVISSEGWKGAYCLFFGWWLAFFPAREIYIRFKWDLGL